MSSILGQVCTVPGVIGAALFDDLGVCVEHRDLPAPYSIEELGRILNKLLVGFEAYAYVERAPFRYAFAQYGGSVFAVLRTPAHRAIVLADSDINRSLLAVAFGALEVKLAELQRGSSTSDLMPGPVAEPAGDDGLPAAMLSRLQDLLAEAIGPIAKLLIAEHRGRFAGQPPAQLWSSLVAALAQEIPDERERKVFIAKLRQK